MFKRGFGKLPELVQHNQHKHASVRFFTVHTHPYGKHPARYRMQTLFWNRFPPTYYTPPTKSCTTTICRNSFRWLSDKATDDVHRPNPLILWVINTHSNDEEAEDDEDESDEEDDDDMNEAGTLLLMPNVLTNTSFVTSVDEIVNTVNQHYDGDSTHRFVGGMGESDPGVWFATMSGTEDVLVEDNLGMLGEAMELCRQNRHGVPFVSKF